MTETIKADLAEIEDNNVSKSIQKTAKKLSKKYSKVRNVDENVLKQKSVGYKILSYFLSVLCAVCVVVCLTFSFSVIFNKANNLCPTYMGFSTMVVSSGSMSENTINIDGTDYSSGFLIGDKIVIRSVDTKTLKVGDKIAFYVYEKNYKEYHNLSKTEITTNQQTKTKYSVGFLKFFGIHNNHIIEAGKNNSKLVFHHITNIYEDENKKLWFKTKGSANPTKDAWFVSEEMIVGIYDNSKASSAISKFYDFFMSSWGFVLILIIPIILLATIMIKSFIKNLYLGFLELDVVEEKRKLTDEICVKNDIGFLMDRKTKYKVLAQASDDEKMTYINLLWKDKKESMIARKYVLRKRIKLAPIKKLLDLNRECSKMFNEKVPINKIAKFYNEEKEKIKQEQKQIETRLKNLSVKKIK